MNFFRFLFGQDGDRSSVPQATQPDGTVSYQQGFGPDYARDQATDPLAKDIPRNQMNQLLYDLTESARQFQTFGAFPFITAAQNGGTAFPYAKNARALWTDGEVYVSLIDNNTDPDPSASTNWAVWIPNPQPARAIMPAGFVGHHFGTTAPEGYVRRNGLTIGNAGSGATERANADCAQLFAQIWNSTSNVAPFIIQDSGGAATTRGVSAAADFAAGKRMPLPNDLGRTDRGWNYTGGGLDAGRVLGSTQDDAVGPLTFTTNLKMAACNSSSSGGSNSSPPQSGNPGAGTSYNNPTAVTVTATNTATETRVDNSAYLPIISLGV